MAFRILRSRQARETLAIVLAVTLAASACGDSDEGGAEALTDTWVLTSGTRDGLEIPLVDGYRITFVIEGDSVGGTSACNLYGGDVEVEGDSFRVGMLSVTERGCEPAVMASESAYLAALGSVDRFAVDGDELVLSGPETALHFEALPPVPAAELVGTVWVLETLIEGDTATSATGEPAVLELRADGSMVGSTGCRTLSGAYVVEGDEVFATSLSAVGECPAELTDQDSHVLTVLGDGFTVRIDGH